MNKEIYLPEHIFKYILDYCNDTPIKKHNKRMKSIIGDIDLFTDLYSTILEDYIMWNISDDFNNEVVQDYFTARINNPKRLHYFIQYHEYGSDTYNYDFKKIWKIEKKLIYHHIENF
tara:strand:+ start:126 stop:476 length:351 start_codon:yes stop_codon:yes gene_type:complete